MSEVVPVNCTGCGAPVGEVAYGAPGAGAVFRPDPSMKRAANNVYASRPKGERQTRVNGTPPSASGTTIRHGCGAVFGVRWSNRGRASG